MGIVIGDYLFEQNYTNPFYSQYFSITFIPHYKKSINYEIR
jgi:hypothetical protein